MPVSVIVGGQFGSEGKGKVAHHWARATNASIAVRVGGPNSGHSVLDATGTCRILRQLPTAAVLQNTRLVLSAGSVIDVDLLMAELSLLGVEEDRVVIDPNALVITEPDKDAERLANLRERIGSTLSGTGAAIEQRTRRGFPLARASDEPRLQGFVTSTHHVLRQALARGERVIIEGTQGFGLSPIHSPYYPYVTSRDTTAASFVAEAGLSPRDVDEVVLVLRTYPIRVGGHSGPLPEETSWEQVTASSGSDVALREFTSATNRIRRVARFDASVVRNAIVVNNPSAIVLNHLDYIDARQANSHRPSGRVSEFVRRIEGLIQRRTDWLGLGPGHLVTNPAVQTNQRSVFPGTHTTPAAALN